MRTCDLLLCFAPFTWSNNLFKHKSHRKLRDNEWVHSLPASRSLTSTQEKLFHINVSIKKHKQFPHKAPDIWLSVQQRDVTKSKQSVFSLSQAVEILSSPPFTHSVVFRQAALNILRYSFLLIHGSVLPVLHVLAGPDAPPAWKSLSNQEERNWITQIGSRSCWSRQKWWWCSVGKETKCSWNKIFADAIKRCNLFSLPIW